MGLVAMSERELRRVETMAQIEDGALTPAQAAGILGISTRQVFRMLARYRTGGPAALAHGARGRPSNNRIPRGRKEYVLSLVAERYADFGPTLAAETLAREHDVVVSRETLRGWMAEAGLWLSRTQRKRFHQPRRRREHLGELVQIDGSEHRWFEDRGDPCSLLVFIDDATSRLMHLRFVPSESTFAYFEALEGYLTKHGRPITFYSDKHSVFRANRRGAADGGAMTQFGRALAELQIEILCANSSQAKGRVERANRTLQDRLVKALRLAGVSDIAAGNTFLDGFVAEHNTRFAQAPARETDLHRPVGLDPERLADVLCVREKRRVGQQLTLMYERQKVMLEVTDTSREFVGEYVDLYGFPDGRFEVRWKGVSLPYTVFDKTQRVTHAAIVENKRLAEVLAFVKAQQDTLPPPRVKSSEGAYIKGQGRKAKAPTQPRVKPFVERWKQKRFEDAQASIAAEAEGHALPG